MKREDRERYPEQRAGSLQGPVWWPAGCWDDIRITSTWRYICEKNVEGGQFTPQAPSQGGTYMGVGTYMLV